jgi:Tn7-like transposition protein D/TniQ
VRVLLGWFPKVYENELLYSFIARYYNQSSYTSVKEVLYELFDDSRAKVAPDFPSNLEVLYKRLSIFNSKSLDEYIYQHTPFFYFTNFVNEKQRKVILSEIKSSNSKNVQIYTGLIASTVKEPAYFKYCTLCFKNDISCFGETFWRSSHQLPSVFVCTIHKALLHYSSVIYRDKNSLLMIPNYETCQPNSLNRCIRSHLSPNDLELLFKIALQSELLLTNKLNINVLSLTKFYKDLLREQGYLTTKGYIKQECLYDDFISFYGLNILTVLQSVPTNEEGTCWLKKITRKQRNSIHPIRHILLLTFLGIDLNSLTLIENKGPFGNAPFPCLNKAAKHFGKSIIPQVNIIRCTETGKPIGVFTCRCGFQYTRLGPDTMENDKYRYRYIRSYGIEWENKVREYIDEKKISFRKTAQLLEVDVGTVIKYYKNPSEKNSNVSDVTVKSEKDTYYSIWANIKTEYPLFTKTELRNLNPGVYAWLYRNEREWLNTNSPSQQRRKINNNRVDWVERDAEILILIKKFLLNINHKNKPVRLTKRYLGVSINKLSLIEKKLDLLPRTKLFLESIVESSYEYKIKLNKWKQIYL